MNALLRLAPWYKPAEIEERERHTEEVRRQSVRQRIRLESEMAQQRINRR